VEEARHSDSHRGYTNVPGIANTAANRCPVVNEWVVDSKFLIDAWYSNILKTILEHFSNPSS